MPRLDYYSRTKLFMLCACVSIIKGLMFIPTNQPIEVITQHMFQPITDHLWKEDFQLDTETPFYGLVS